MELNFTNGALIGAAAGAIVGHICWQRPWYGAVGGVIHATMAVAVKTLFGRKVFTHMSLSWGLLVWVNWVSMQSDCEYEKLSKPCYEAGHLRLKESLSSHDS